MGLKNLLKKLLCCSEAERKQSLDIGLPTDVRRMDISEGMPGLTDEERLALRTKLSTDAFALAALHTPTQSQPPSRTRTPSPSASTNFNVPPTQPRSGLSPSKNTNTSPLLLNPTSTSTPSQLPTPPRHQQGDEGEKARSTMGMKRARNNQSPILENNPKEKEGEKEDKPLIINLQALDVKKACEGDDSPVGTVNTQSSTEACTEDFEKEENGFKMVSEIRGGGGDGKLVAQQKKSGTVVRKMENADSSSDSEDDVVEERKPLFGD